MKFQISKSKYQMNVKVQKSYNSTLSGLTIIKAKALSYSI